MKVNYENANYAVIRTAFHGGGTIAFTDDLESAIEIERENTAQGCTCGCCSVVPVTKEAMKKMNRLTDEFGDFIYYRYQLYDEYPVYTANGEPYGKLCR